MESLGQAIKVAMHNNYSYIAINYIHVISLVYTYINKYMQWKLLYMQDNDTIILYIIVDSTKKNDNVYSYTIWHAFHV